MPVTVDDFYTTFWSLQRFFTNPPSLFQPSIPPVNAFEELNDGLTQTLDTFAAATKKEKELQGASKEGGERKLGKRKEEDEEEIKSHYFFPKFLTSRNLLELEVHFPFFYLHRSNEFADGITAGVIDCRSYFSTSNFNPVPRPISIPSSFYTDGAHEMVIYPWSNYIFSTIL